MNNFLGKFITLLFVGIAGVSSFAAVGKIINESETKSSLSQPVAALTIQNRSSKVNQVGLSNLSATSSQPSPKKTTIPVSSSSSKSAISQTENVERFSQRSREDLDD